MVILSNCYKYIKTQLSVLDDKKDITYEGLREGTDFCKEQKNKKPPTFCNIYKKHLGYDECTNDNSLSDLNPGTDMITQMILNILLELLNLI